MNLSLDHTNHVPLYLQARDLIKNQVYINGKLLPNEVALARQLAISRTTLRQAINKLIKFLQGNARQRYSHKKLPVTYQLGSS